VKLEASQHEEAWKGAGKAPGLEIWRIEKFKIVAWAKNQYGNFFSGDSYIVLYTYKANPDSAKLSYDVHFWLGKFTTQDEAGTAAYKTVELDDSLGGAPVQHREVMGYESKRFMSYFPKGIRISDGGVETGFHHVDAASYRPRLLHLKGKKQVRVIEVPLNHHSLNSGDVFIVDNGAELIQWNGKQAGIMEKAKAAELCQAIENERNGRCKARVISEGDDDADFWKLLGGKGAIASAAAGGSDVEAEHDTDKLLYRLSDASGSLQFTEVARGKKINPKLLDSNDVFVLDTGEEVISWVGKHASVGEKKKAMQFAQDYITKHNKPLTTPVSRVLEGGENEVWAAFFH